MMRRLQRAASLLTPMLANAGMGRADCCFLAAVWQSDHARQALVFSMDVLEQQLMFTGGSLLCAVAGSVTDVRERRIPNLVTGPAAVAGLMLHMIYGGWRGLRDLDYVVISRALGGRTRSRGELLSFLLFDPLFVSELISLGRRDAGRWLRRHPGFWCRDAAHDLSIGPMDHRRLAEQEALDEFRALRRREPGRA